MFLFQVLEVLLQVGRLLMLLWVACYSTVEFLARVLNGGSVYEESLVELADLFQKVGGMGVSIKGRGELSVFFGFVAT